MNRRLKDIVIDLLNGHRIMSISTNRPDGWPQTTLVGYVNDGFLLYCFVARNSQKYANILRDPRISIAIGSDVADPRNIKGLPLAAKASVVTDPAEFDYVSELRLKRNPEYATYRRRPRQIVPQYEWRRSRCRRRWPGCALPPKSSRWWTTRKGSVTAT